MSDQAIELRATLKEHFPWHGQRLAFLASFLLTVITVRTVNLSQLAAAFIAEASEEANYRRLRRFFKDFSLPMTEVAAFVLKHLAGDAPYVVSIDRTNWKFGLVDINFLVVAIVSNAENQRRLALPIVWTILKKAGASNTRDRIAILKRFCELVDRQKIAYIVADREFIGSTWFQWLIEQKFDFSIRVKQSLLIDNGTAKKISLRRMFANLKRDERCVLRKPRRICGCRLYLSVLRLADGELLLLVSPRYAHHAIEEYRLRWPIETLFGCLKSRGFDLEATHMTDPERLERLFALLVIATVWAYEVGQWLDEVEPLKLKAHKRRAMSTFRRGLDFLINMFMNISRRLDDFSLSLQLLSGT